MIDVICSELESWVSGIKGWETALEAERPMSHASLSSEPRAPETNPGGLPLLEENDESNDNTSAASELEKFDYGDALKSIHDGIEWLHRLSFTVRRPSVINQQLHAQSRNILKAPG